MTEAVKNQSESSYSVSKGVSTTTPLLTRDEVQIRRQLMLIRHDVEALGIRWTPQLQTMAAAWLRQVSVDLVTDYALPAVAMAPHPSARYLAAIMRRCLGSGYKTAAEAYRHDEEDKQRYLSSKKPPDRRDSRYPGATVNAQRYNQRDYSGEPEINDLLDWIKEG